jgi:hypothetical protein
MSSANAQIANPRHIATSSIGVAMSKQARITGIVEYREGEGANIVIRKGRCEVEESALDVTISWKDGDSRGSTAMPLADFRRYLANQAIQVDEAQPSSAQDAKQESP